MQPQHREVRVKNDEYERKQQRLAKQIKHMVLRNDHIFTFCAVRKHAHILELFQRNAYALPSFSHFTHFVALARPTVPKACATPTNPHVLVQRRYTRGIHCNYVHLVIVRMVIWRVLTMFWGSVKTTVLMVLCQSRLHKFSWGSVRATVLMGICGY